jgi:heterodisulfide reductase subunit B
MTLEYVLYPGCVASVREIGYELAVRRVFEELGVKLHQSNDFNCCMPACLVHSVDYVRGLALTSRNLVVAEELGLPMLTLCSSCFGNLSRAKYMLDTNPQMRKDVNDVLASAGREYKGEAQVEHVLTILHKDYTVEKLRGHISKPLSGIVAAPFHGCHIFMPAKYSGFDDPEFPNKLDTLMATTGVQVADYNEKTSCCIGCGSFFGDVSQMASLLLVDRILRSAKDSGADCIVTTCPFCIMQLEIGQIKLREEGKDYGLPVLHFVDLLGLSMGLESSELGFELRRVSVKPLLAKVNG